MTPPGRPFNSYQVVYPGTVREFLVSLILKANRIGIKSQVLASIRAIDDRL